MNIFEFINKNKTQIEKFDEIQALDPERARVLAVFESLAKDCAADEQLKDYYERLVESCYNYTDIVCDFYRVTDDFGKNKISRAEYQERFDNIDQQRSFVHNATIDSFNILSRLMAKKNLNTDWIKSLIEGGRVVYGNYAIKKSIADAKACEQNNPKENNE